MRCNTVQPLQHIVTHCNTLCNTQTHRKTLCNTATLHHCNTATLQHCNTILYHPAPNCNTLQHTHFSQFQRVLGTDCKHAQIFAIIRALLNSTIFPQHCLSAARFLQSIFTIYPYNLSWYFSAALFFCSTVFTISNGICLLRYFCNL